METKIEQASALAIKRDNCVLISNQTAIEKDY